MRRAVLFCCLWVAPAAAFAPVWPADPDAHIRAENTMVFDRWQGSRVDPVERISVRQRLALTWFAKRRARRQDWGLDFGLDLRIDANLSPSASEQERLVGRRPALDARRASLRFDNVVGVLDAEVGRHLVADALGLELYDGGTAWLRAPFVGLGFSAGLAATPGWNEFGPSVFAPDGTIYDDALAWVVGGRVQTLDLPWLNLGAAVRQRRSRGEIQRSQAGASGQLRYGPFAVGGRLTADLVYNRIEDAEVVLEATGPAGGALGWRRRWPTFRADSIWNAFSSNPYSAFFARGHLPVGQLRFEADAALRRFDAGDGIDGANSDATVPDGGQNHEVGARVVWQPAVGQIGVEGRYADGYGGARHYADIFLLHPLPLWRPVDMTLRLGAVSVSPQEDDDAELSGWALLALDWPIASTVRLLAQTEAYTRGDAPFRMRAMTHIRFEDWW